MKRTRLSRGTKQMRRTPLRKVSKTQRIKKIITTKGYKPPSWFNSIKPGAHGNTPAQKKLWRLVSESIRKEEFEKYGGKCVSCPRRLESWQDGQCAHFKPWSVCNGFFKYERKNLALSCSNCNRLSGGEVGFRFAEELKRRYGEDILTWIETENETHRGEKMELWLIVERAEKLSPQTVSII